MYDIHVNRSDNGGVGWPFLTPLVATASPSLYPAVAWDAQSSHAWAVWREGSSPSWTIQARRITAS